MKHLPKHLRPRWRYLAVTLETWPDAELSERALQRRLWFAAQNLLGDPGSADADLTVIRSRFWTGGGEAIVRSRRGTVEEARAALACIESIQDHPVRVAVEGTSGTVRAAEENYLGGPAEASREEQVVFRNDTAAAVIREDLADVEVAGSFVGATTRDLT
ncbi:MAG: Rpp14/Pop5 family protein [Halodesulfurarchaeum sp.]